MASSKNLFLLFGLLIAIVLLISSATSEKTVKANIGVEEVKHGGPGYGAYLPLQGGCPRGCCRTNRVFRCLRCCTTADESANTKHEDEVKN